MSLPLGKRTITSKFNIKHTPSGDAERFKAQLYAKGYAQNEGEDFSKTFSPVVKYDSVRTLLATATGENLEMLQFDIKTAFLNGDLSEQVYMDIPEENSIEGKAKNKVCKLIKALYGLKQSACC